MMTEETKKIIKDILSHRYMINSRCLTCGKAFTHFSNRKTLKVTKNDFCSKDCYKQFKQKQNKVYHFEVFKDQHFYYIKVDSIFQTKRDISNKCSWSLKSVIHPLDNTTKILNSDEKIPENAVKIIDKTSTFLYENEHTFDNWKNLKSEIEIKKP